MNPADARAVLECLGEDMAGDVPYQRFLEATVFYKGSRCTMPYSKRQRTLCNVKRAWMWLWSGRGEAPLPKTSLQNTHGPNPGSLHSRSSRSRQRRRLWRYRHAPHGSWGRIRPKQASLWQVDEA